MIKKAGIISFTQLHYDQRAVSNQKTREKFSRNNLYFGGGAGPPRPPNRSPCTLSTSNERFFLGGQCGDIYEFIYEENIKSTLNKLGQTFLSNLVPSFLQITSSSSNTNSSSTTIKQISIDHKKLLLFARLGNDSLQIYDISTDKGQRLFNYTFDDLINKLKQRQTISYDDYRPFLTMYTVQSYESNLFNLILVTHTGIRLYYTLIMPTGN